MNVDNIIDNLATDRYFVKHYRNDPDRIIVSFSSLGFASVGGAIEEFKRTLDRTGVSCIFVTDRGANWYNNPETDHILFRIAEMCEGYRHVGAIGESSGGCGAIMFSNYCAKLSRVLAFSPQFSVVEPYLGFDKRDAACLEAITQFAALDFSTCSDKRIVQLLYGNRDWRDFIHSSMFSALDFDVLRVEGAHHEVAAYLKKHPDGDYLSRIVNDFADFSFEFNQATLLRQLAPVIARKKLQLQSGEMFAAALPRYSLPLQATPDTSLKVYSRNRPATQSSISEWSRPTPEDDAAGAVDGRFDRSFGFHTATESNPWWEVDLGTPIPIKEIRIFNRSDSFEIAARSSSFAVLARDHAKDAWETIYRRESLTPIGLNNEPFCWRPVTSIYTRYVRIQSLLHQAFHLKQVEVCG